MMGYGLILVAAVALAGVAGQETRQQIHELTMSEDYTVKEVIDEITKLPKFYKTKGPAWVAEQIASRLAKAKDKKEKIYHQFSVDDLLDLNKYIKEQDCKPQEYNRRAKFCWNFEAKLRHIFSLNLRDALFIYCVEFQEKLVVKCEKGGYDKAIEELSEYKSKLEKLNEEVQGRMKRWWLEEDCYFDIVGIERKDKSNPDKQFIDACKQVVESLKKFDRRVMNTNPAWRDYYFYCEGIVYWATK